MRQSLSAIVAALAVLAGCGVDERTPQVRLSLEEEAIAGRVRLIRLAFVPQTLCSSLKIKVGNNPDDATVNAVGTSDVGPIGDADRQGSVEIVLNKIPAGTYTAFAFGGPTLEAPTDFGCVESVVIEDGKQAEFTIAITEI